MADGTTPDRVMLVDHVLPQLTTVVDRLHDAGALLEIGAGAGLHTLRHAEAFPTCRIARWG
jgi:methylase of polypeptide subunit release factors